jgi:heme-degrading monooxygenase HmoA
MIVRIWHGKVPSSKAKEYTEFLNRTAIPGYRKVEGNISAQILERQEGDVTHFLTVTHWKDLESIKGFAGEDIEKAKYIPEDEKYLLEFEEKVQHYNVVGQSW